MGMGFIPRDENRDPDCLSMISDRWQTEQAIEALELNSIIKVCCADLLNEVAPNRRTARRRD